MSALDGPEVRPLLRRLRSRGTALAFTGAVGFAAGGWMLSKSDSPDGEVRNVWDVVGGLVTAAGLVGIVVGLAMAVHSLRWRRHLARHEWRSTPFEAVAARRRFGLGRVLVQFPGAGGDSLYTPGWTAVQVVAMVLDGHVATIAGGNRGVLVAWSADRRHMITLRPPRTSVTRRRWARWWVGSPPFP